MASEKIPSLANLPGQTPDSSARDRRKEYKNLDFTEDELNKLISGKINLEGAERTAESYALSSFVIEALWDHMKRKLATDPLVLSQEGVTGDTVAKRFVAAMNTRLDQYRDSFVDEIHTSMSSETLPKEEILNIRYLKLIHEDQGKLGVPSMRDLVTLLGRMADVIPKTFQRDLGREASDEDLFYALSHPSLKRFFVEVMTNSKPLSMFLLNRIEKDKSKDLDEPDGEFDPAFFEIAYSDDQKEYVRFRPKIIGEIREILRRVAEMRVEQGKEPPRTLVCPVLYTGKFLEMFNWVKGAYEDFYKDSFPK